MAIPSCSAWPNRSSFRIVRFALDQEKSSGGNFECKMVSKEGAIMYVYVRDEDIVVDNAKEMGTEKRNRWSYKEDNELLLV